MPPCSLEDRNKSQKARTLFADRKPIGPGPDNISIRQGPVPCRNEECSATGEAVIVTKRGEPIVKVVPVEREKKDNFGRILGKVKIVGDIGTNPG